MRSWEGAKRWGVPIALADLAASAVTLAVVSWCMERDAAEAALLSMLLTSLVQAVLLVLALSWENKQLMRTRLALVFVAAPCITCALLPVIPLCVILPASFLFLGRGGRPLREEAGIAAISTAWRTFSQHSKGTRYAFRAALAQTPILLLTVAICLGTLGSSWASLVSPLLGLFGAATTHGTGGGSLVLAVLVPSAVLWGVAVVAVTIAAVLYPWAQRQHFVVLQRFEPSLGHASGRPPLRALGLLLGLDLLLVLMCLFPGGWTVVHLLLLDGPLKGVQMPIWLTGILLWPLGLAGMVWVRLHYREVLVLTQYSFVDSCKRVVQLFGRRFFDAWRGLCVQLALIALTLAWFCVAWVPAVAGVAVVASASAAVHATAYYLLGLKGAGHLTAVALEAPVLLLLFVFTIAVCSSPLLVFQALHRLFYVRAVSEASEGDAEGATEQ